MSESPVERMRREFDATFAEAVDLRRDDTIDLLTLAVDERRVAVPVGDLAGVQLCPPLTALPGADSRLLGIAGVRGLLVLVYDLGALLGQGKTRPRRFLALRGPDGTTGVAFDALESYLRVPRAALRPSAGRRATEVVETASGALAVVRVANLLTGEAARGSEQGEDGR